MSGDSQTQGLNGGNPPLHPWRHIRDAASLKTSDPDSLDQFAAVCFHYAEALTVQFKAAGKTPPTLGLIAMAIDGSTIEEWIPNDVAETCFGFQGNANGAQLYHVLWDANVKPFLDMTLKGWLYYQVRQPSPARPSTTHSFPLPTHLLPPPPPPPFSPYY